MEKDMLLSLVLNYCQLGSIPVPVDPGLQGCILTNKHLKTFLPVSFPNFITNEH